MKPAIFLSKFFYNTFAKCSLPEGYYSDKSIHGDPYIDKKTKGVFATTGEQFCCFK
jgi:hypothetical protein